MTNTTAEQIFSRLEAIEKYHQTMEFYSETPCKHCAGTGRQLNSHALSRLVKKSPGTLESKAQRLGLKQKAHLAMLLAGRRNWPLHLAQKAIKLFSIQNPNEYDG